MLFALIGIWLGLLTPALFQALPQRVFGVMTNDTLLALPFFTFMGLILERSGMAEDLLETVGQLFGPVRGGLAFAVVFVGALMAATTGVVSASVISMGLISLPIMLRYGYDRRVATGVIAASGTLSQIIPPSLTLIVLADQLGRSVGDMYRAALVPGLILTGLYILYVGGIALFRPNLVPETQAATSRSAPRTSAALGSVQAAPSGRASFGSWRHPGAICFRGQSGAQFIGQGLLDRKLVAIPSFLQAWQGLTNAVY